MKGDWVQVRKTVGAIEKARESLATLKAGKYTYPDLALSGCYDRVLKLKLDEFEIGVSNGFGQKLIMGFEPDIVISPVFLVSTPRRKKTLVRIKDWLSVHVFESVFIDLKNKRIDLGTSDSSGGRGRYDMFSMWCESRKVQTFVPIYSGERLLRLYYFRRFVGRISFQYQWNRDIGDFGLKGYENVSHLSAGFSEESVRAILFPEKKDVMLLEFRRNPIV